MTLYQKVAGEVEALIRSRSFLPGEKIPSIREMRSKMGVSVPTIVQAYMLLEDRGLIESRPQSGYYVLPSVPEPPEFEETLPLAQKQIDDFILPAFSRALVDRSIIALTEAFPQPDHLPTKSLFRILSNLCKKGDPSLLLLEEPQGNQELRRRIARRAAGQGIPFSAREVIITNGGFESWNLCLRTITSPGDCILVGTPTYHGVYDIVSSLGLKPVEIPVGQDGIWSREKMGELLARYPVRAGFFMPHFACIRGKLPSETELKGIVDLFAARGIPIIEDDIYGDIYFGPRRSQTLKAFDRKGQVLFCSSFAKTTAPGFRLAWTLPGVYQEKFLRLKYLNSISSPALSQAVLAEFLSKGSYERHLRELRRKLGKQLPVYRQALSDLIPSSVSISSPESGHVLWVELPSGVDVLRLHQMALENKILIAPGPIFSFQGNFSAFLRLSFANPWSARIERAIRHVGELISREIQRTASNRASKPK